MAPVKKQHEPLGRHFLGAWRQKCGLSQLRAAERLDIDRSVLSKIESYKVPYSQRLIEAAAQIYKRTPAELLGSDPKRAHGPSIDALLLAKPVSPEDWQLIYDMASRLGSAKQVSEPQPRDRKALITETAARSPDQKSPASKPGA